MKTLSLYVDYRSRLVGTAGGFLAAVTLAASAQTQNLPPVAVAQDVEVPASAICDAIVTAEQVDGGSTDPNGDSLTLTLTPAAPYALGETEVTLTVDDGNGGTDTDTAIITVVDTTPPTITCPSDIVADNDAGECGAIVTFEASAEDNCSGVTVSYSPDSGSFFDVGTTTVTVTATDEAGNTSSCSFDVTVNDVEAPVIDPEAADQTVECDGAGNTEELEAWLASYGGAMATDNCSFTWSSDFTGLSDDCAATGSATVTFTATDPAGNSTSTTATFSIVDTTPPEIFFTQDGEAVSGTTTMKPNEVPVVFDISSSDVCGEVVEEVVEVTCHKFTKKGKRIDKSESCEVEISGTQVTILDSGGVGDIITIFVDATDECGNVGSAQLEITVINPGKGNKPNHPDRDRPKRGWEREDHPGKGHAYGRAPVERPDKRSKVGRP
jgi:hypothetical protein